MSLIYIVFFIQKFAYIKNRIFSFFNPDTGTHGAQAAKSVDGISSGGFFGKGIGEGTLKNRVPEAHTDYIISVISEEFGVVAIVLLLTLFLFFIYTVFKKIYLEKNELAANIIQRWYNDAMFRPNGSGFETAKSRFESNC